MSRPLPEWIGPLPSMPPPARVMLRVFLRFDGRCQCGCNRQIRPGDSWQIDHKLALINGGENRENNLQPMLTEHHRNKTRTDMAEKSRSYERQLAHVGIKRRRAVMPGSRASGWKRRMDGSVVRR